MNNGAEQQARIVVGVDGSDHARHALQEAWKFAGLMQASLEAVTAWQYPLTFGSYASRVWDPEQEAAEILDGALAKAYPAGLPEGVQKKVRMGPAARVLLDAGQGADLIVVGGRGRGGFTGTLLGSVSAAVAAHAHVSVLVTHLDHGSGSPGSA